MPKEEVRYSGQRLSAIHSGNEQLQRLWLSQEDVSYAGETLCGLGNCKPHWLQRFASPKTYLLIFSFVSLTQGAYITYFAGILSTIEKRFAFKSKTAGILLIADNISPIITGALVGFYGGSGHRPRWLAAGMILSSLSCLTSALPYMVFGSGTHLRSKSSDFLTEPQAQFCTLKRSQEGCTTSVVSATVPAIVLLFLGNFLQGFGAIAFYSVGTPYLDDNVRKNDSPLYFGTLFALRLFGPALGFLLSSACLGVYENPWTTPDFGPEDPRWIGAWWLGFVVLGCTSGVLSLPLLLFPRHLKHKEVMPSERTNDRPKKLLLKGTLTMFTMVVGNVGGGAVIKKVKPSPRYLTGYLVAVGIITLGGLLASMFLGCSSFYMPGTTVLNNRLNLVNQCNQNCNCTTEVFEPLCGPDNRAIYFSPCHAGCTSNENLQDRDSIYTNCSCVHNHKKELVIASTTRSYCPFHCGMFVPYIIILCVAKVVSSTASVADTLLILRSVEPGDKSLACGTLEALWSVAAFIPYPMVYGSITDSACLVWEERCGETGNCWIYDYEKFRYYLHGATFVFLGLGTFFEVIVFLLSSRLKNLYSEEDENVVENNENKARNEDISLTQET
ncbi:solute carrier organic anion transporter family member 74D-like isoform X2 [Tachypleus tridentatus]|uniref:solute carrier organic anion transporter family member 74D-like isoform X2 n=1 Tax=Tachypleus tridentatus TaxID=6853 RepID=UPI003FD4554E